MDNLNGKIVECSDINNMNVKGRVALVYDDAIASGTNMYVNVTYLMVCDKDGNAYTVRPRDVHRVSDEY